MMTDTEREMERAERRVAVLEVRASTVKMEVRILKAQTAKNSKR